MPITLAGLQLIASIYQDGVLSNYRSVMEIGAQDLTPKQDDVANLLSRLVGLQRNPDAVTTPELLYKSLGFTVYKCIDPDGPPHALRFDLNKDIVQDYDFSEQFHVVANHGTTEHVFDQCRAFKNIHDLCARNGIMMHEVPFHNRLNDGFFNYQPTFFYDLASANDYALVGIYLGLPTVGDIMPYSDDMARVLFGTHIDMELLVVLQKMTERQFHNPYNGKYLKTCLLVDSYGTQHATVSTQKQFSPGITTIRGNSSSDINQMTTKRIAQILLRRVVRKVLSA